MGYAKRRTNSPPDWATRGNRRFVPLYYDLLDSPAYLDLLPSARALLPYIVRCANMEKYKKTSSVAKDYPGIEAFQSGDFFYFNWEIASRTAVCSEKTFHKAIQALIKNGFIECFARGNGQQRKNIYRMSDAWKQYATEQGARPL